MSTKSVSMYEKLLTTQVENVQAVSHFNTKHSFSALEYAQDFGTTVKESRKRIMNSKWTSFTKSRIAPCLKILSCLCQLSQRHVSPISANSDRREVVLRDCTTNFKKRINARQSGIFNTSVTGLCHAVCYLFRTKTFFCIK